ncbi:MAG: flagellar hook-associated protein FlgK [Rhodospirillales bacterium 20-64-7]|nr:MAG: flagellar hook-associated protein FlgK [Rhodospirillales bacterium 20-64-7]HQT75431.1 flagellar hook-associated protein FlgK [Rhodopila sp.]
MGLTSALSIANSGLANINAQFSILSQNIANAATPGYAAESGTQQSLTADGIGLGVRTGPATRAINQALQASVIQQNAIVAGSQTTQTALQAIDSVLGTPGSGADLGSLLGNVQNSFSTLLNDPGNQTQQNAVVTAASTLAQGMNTLSASYTAQRQAAQNDLQSAVTTLNTTLSSIGQLSRQITSLQLSGQSSADLQNQRDAAVQTLSGLIQVNAVAQPNGDLSLFTSSGISLPTSGPPNTFAMQPATVGAQGYYPGGGLPGITLNGSDVTGQMVGGRIGADIALRDQTLPTAQAQLDEFAYGVASRFAQQGLTLFTDQSGTVPTGGGSPAQAGYVGFAASIQVNPAVTATPSLVRDGTNTVPGSATGASAFTPNPTGGPAGFTTLISRVLSYALGTQAQAGVPQPALETSGLGPTGTLSAPFSAAGDSLGSFATSLISTQAQQSATVTSTLTNQQALQNSLNAKVASGSGVNMDTEMSQMLTLQNAYGVNARVISAVQTMFYQLLQAIQ